ncbi:LCP family glycopolymer transferase [Alkalihalophilus marmarensis]|uniref:LCP family glycopolymer transferase n=1 Tax=Alkalihalophilus marmarensis TaxID=521377 RepID=UPI002DBDD943|nr:LCP family protein [Alkalihalophilus marmarensis]MEC2071186.1 LCP family protein [Alkalihalophilus marmarensis]
MSDKMKKIVLILMTAALVLVVGAGGYVWSAATSAFGSIQENLDRSKSEKRLEELNLDEGEPISVLLMGVDELEGREDLGRSDTMILLTINPNQESIQMVSIPRDTLVDIRGYVTKDKISHAHALGGRETAVYTVEHFLDVPVDYYVKVNMESFKDTVDAVGGIEVENDQEFTFHEMHYPKGTIKLDGEKALGYARMRHLDPDDDFGRQERQRQVMEAVMEKGSSISSLTNFNDILNVVEENVLTNLSLGELWDIYTTYNVAIDQIEQHELQGEDIKKDGIYYFSPDEDELASLSTKLKEHLELED